MEEGEHIEVVEQHDQHLLPGYILWQDVIKGIKTMDKIYVNLSCLFSQEKNPKITRVHAKTGAFNHSAGCTGIFGLKGIKSPLPYLYEPPNVPTVIPTAGTMDHAIRVVLTNPLKSACVCGMCVRVRITGEIRQSVAFLLWTSQNKQLVKMPRRSGNERNTPRAETASRPWTEPQTPTSVLLPPPRYPLLSLDHP